MAREQNPPQRPVKPPRVIDAEAEETTPEQSLGLTPVARSASGPDDADDAEAVVERRNLADHVAFGLDAAEQLATLGMLVGGHFRLSRLGRHAARLREHVGFGRKALPMFIGMLKARAK